MCYTEQTARVKWRLSILSKEGRVLPDQNRGKISSSSSTWMSKTGAEVPGGDGVLVLSPLSPDSSPATLQGACERVRVYICAFPCSPVFMVTPRGFCFGTFLRAGQQAPISISGVRRHQSGLDSVRGLQAQSRTAHLETQWTELSGGPCEGAARQEPAWGELKVFPAIVASSFSLS